MKIKQLDNVTYVSRPALNGAMCCPGELIEVKFFNSDDPCTKGTVRFYATDGWSINHLGRYRPEQLLEIAELVLNKGSDAANDLFSSWCKNNPMKKEKKV